MLHIRPDQIPDSLAPVSDDEVERYYAAHKGDFKRPATAWLSFVAQPRVADAADTAAALARARRLRDEIARGAAKFEDVAKKESADSVSGARGGDLGWVKRNETGFDSQFLAGLRGLTPGQLSQPVRSTFGYHLIRVEAAKGDSLHVRHILIPIVPQGRHLDAIDARTDTLDRLAATQTDGSRLDSAAQRLHLPVAQAPKLVQGDRLTLGRYVIPDVSVWAFEARVGETSPVIEGERANYVFRLDWLHPAEAPQLAQVGDRVRETVRYEKKKALARQRANGALAALADAPDLLQAGRARGLPVEKVGPFARLNPPNALARDPVVLGAAFGLRPRQRTGVLAGETGFFILQGIARPPADSAAWLKQREQQREAILRPAQQARVQQYLAGLKAQARVVDRRKEIFPPSATERRAQPLGIAPRGRARRVEIARGGGRRVGAGGVLQAALELLDTPAERRSDLRNPLRAEHQHQHEQQDQDVAERQVPEHTCLVFKRSIERRSTRSPHPRRPAATRRTRSGRA